MLIPKERLHVEEKDEEQYCTTKFYVWDTDDCAYVENRIFSYYNTKEECQKAIDFFNSFKLVKVS